MTSYTAIPDSDIDPESPGTTTLFTRFRDNPIAMFEKAAGAPVLADGYVVEAMVGSGAISRAKLKSTTASQSVSVPAEGVANISAAGGDYTFGWFPGNGASEEITTRPLAGTYGTVVRFANSDSLSSRTAYLYSRYIQASPPYNLGDGNIPLFVFAAIDNAAGKVIAASAAEDPPWAYHGPTDIAADRYDEQGRGWRGDVEITQAVKQADMPLYPHPWAIDVMDGDYRVVMLNPFDEKITTLSTGDITTALHNGAIKIGATVTGMHTPPGVDFVEWEIGEPDVITPEQLLAEARASMRVTMRQCRLALLSIGKLVDVDAAIASLDEPLKSMAMIEWEYASDVMRISQLIDVLAPALGLDAEAVDNLFIVGAKL
jgi:hypothetical protein